MALNDKQMVFPNEIRPQSFPYNFFFYENQKISFVDGDGKAVMIFFDKALTSTGCPVVQW